MINEMKLAKRWLMSDLKLTQELAQYAVKYQMQRGYDEEDAEYIVQNEMELWEARCAKDVFTLKPARKAVDIVSVREQLGIREMTVDEALKWRKLNKNNAMDLNAHCLNRNPYDLG